MQKRQHACTVFRYLMTYWASLEMEMGSNLKVLTRFISFLAIDSGERYKSESNINFVYQINH